MLKILMALLGNATQWSMSGFASTYSDLDVIDDTYFVNVIFRTDGTVDVLRGNNSDLNNEVNPYVDPTSEAADTWVRCTNQTGDDMTGGDTRGFWHRLSTQRNFEMRLVTSGGPDELQGTFDFELSADSLGLAIRASAIGKTIHVGDLI